MYQTRISPIDLSAFAGAEGKALAQTPAAAGAPTGGTLLTYRLHPSPTPLQVSKPGSLQLAVNNRGTEAVTVESLEFAVVVGTPGVLDSASLTDGNGEFGLESEDRSWTFSDLGNGRFRAVPTTGPAEITTQGLAFTIYVGEIGSVVGTTPLTITERAAYTGQTPEDRGLSVQVSKFPEGFMAGDLFASRTQVAFGETTTLSWEGSAADYSIWDGIKEIRLGDLRTWTTDPLERTTTFTLVVRAQVGGSTAEDHFSITILVSNSSVLAHDLTVEGDAVLRGSVQAAQLTVDHDVRAGGRMYDVAGVVFPQGGIVMWSGTVADIPRGWVLCDGQNDTPDLRGRFIVGWHQDNPDYGIVGAMGGTAQVVLGVAQIPSHAHGGTTADAGSHQHAIEGTRGSDNRVRKLAGTASVYLDYDNNDNRDPGTVEGRGMVITDTIGQHRHLFTTSAVGQGQPHENRPPYYVLAYIMKR